MVLSYYLIISIVTVLTPYGLATPIAAPEPAPFPGWTENYTGHNGYTGAGGNAVGGSVIASSDSKGGLLDLITDKSLLSVFSENAGDGGDASSGTAVVKGLLGGAGSGHSGQASSSGGGKPAGGDVLEKLLMPGAKKYKAGLGGGLIPGTDPLPTLPLNGVAGLNLDDVTLNSNTGNAYSGTGGNAAGGTVSTPGSLVDLWSHNAGNAGKATSGGSLVFRRKDLNKNRFEAGHMDGSHTEAEPKAELESVEARRSSRAFRKVVP